ncbi:hypothetical protein HCN44_004366 [Aphidius gifuensis]|uniref:Uncharacterized protein n=1 Tax=Aphidius gifuensis TaxID=684658 RepID=A0A835CTC1_APHGI|nr:hypothetical protein HCN44_004366 [Aphidius gifuensis]
MEKDLPRAKKPRLDEKSKDLLLTSICNWENHDHVAIEYHHADKQMTLINYQKLYEAKNYIKEFLINYNPGEFIGINYEVPIFCVPALMLGINSAGHSFVCHDETIVKPFDNLLKINYLFSKKIPENREFIKDIIVHNEHVVLSRIKSYSKDIQQPTQTTNEKIQFAYAVATSGSTGDPVIVRVTHASIVTNIHDMKTILNVTKIDKILQLTPLTFDPSIIEIFIALSTGATLVTISNNLKNNSLQLLSIIENNKVTIIQSTPSLFLHRWPLEKLKNTLLSEKSNLKIILLGGEPFPNPKILFKFKHINNLTKIYNIYGITEVSCWASINEINHDSNPEYLGKILSETMFQVRNKNNQIVDDGEGVLFIGSNTRICLINNESIDDIKGVVFRDTGDIVKIDKLNNIYYKGRKNRCIKRFGNRVNLNVLDRHIAQLDFIENCCSIFFDNNHTLNLFISHKKSLVENNFKSIILNHLKALPSYYHPDNIDFVENFKLTRHGKICINSLINKKCLSSNDKLAISKDEIKTNVDKFKSIWNNLLGIGESSLRFLDVGGTSIIALQISTELSQSTDNEYPELIGKMLNNETFEQCSDYISQKNIIVNKNINNIDDKISNSSKNHLAIESIVDESFIESFNSHENTNCLWQKCKGKTIYHQQLKHDKNDIVDLNKLNNIALEKQFNLLKCVDASPTIFQYSNGNLFATVGSHSGLVITVNLINYSDEPWKIKFPDRIEASVLVYDNFTGIVGSYDGFIYCFNLKTGQIYWKFLTNDAVKCTAVFCNLRNNIFFGSYDHHAYCISLKTTPIIYKNSVLFGILDGSCVSLDKNTGNIIWKYKFEYPIFSSPAIVYENLTIFSDVTGTINCFNIDKGSKIWSMKIDGNIFSNLVTQFDSTTNTESIIISSKNKYIYKYKINDKTNNPILDFKINCDSSIISTPWVDDNFITTVSINGDVKILNFKNGQVLKTYSINADVYSSPVFYKNNIVIGSRDNNLWLLSV